MGHFRESSYAYLLFKNGTILIIITSTTSIHKGKATNATVNAQKKHYVIFACYIHWGRNFHFQKGYRAHSGVKLGQNSISNPLVHTTSVVAAAGPHINSLKITSKCTGYKVSVFSQHRRRKKEREKNALWRWQRGGIKKMLKIFLAAVLLYASVVRCFVSRVREFFSFFSITGIYQFEEEEKVVQVGH